MSDLIADLDRNNPGWRLDDVLARRQPIPDDQNSVTILLAAHKLIPKTWFPKVEDQLDFPPPVLLPPRVAAKLAAELKLVAEALAKARKLAKYPRGRFSVSYTPDFITTFGSLDILKARAVARLLQLACRDRLQGADAKGACTDCLALLNTARSIGDEPMGLCQLVRIALDTITIWNLEQTLAQGEIPLTFLSEVQKSLAKKWQNHYFTTQWLGNSAE